MMAATVQQAAKNAAVSIADFRVACEALKSKETKLASDMSASGMAFRPVFAPYYQRSIDRATEAEKKTKTL